MKICMCDPRPCEFSTNSIISITSAVVDVVEFSRDALYTRDDIAAAVRVLTTPRA